jgi:flagellar biogenesis protein FliO
VNRESIVSLLSGLLAFAGLAAVCYWGLKQLSRRRLSLHRGSHLLILDRIAVSRENSILIVRLAERVLAVGVAKDGFHTLCEFSREEWERDTSEAPREENTNGGKPKRNPRRILEFWRLFFQNFKTAGALMAQKTPVAETTIPESFHQVPISFGDQLQQAQALQASQTVTSRAQVLQAQASQTETSQAQVLQAQASQAQAPQAETSAQDRPRAVRHMPEIVPVTVVSAETSVTPRRIDYNAAIETMKQYGRMEKVKAAPLAVTAAYAATAATLPPAAPEPAVSAAAPPAEPPAEPSAQAPEAPAIGKHEQELEDLLERLAKRTDRLSRVKNREDRRKAE